MNKPIHMSLTDIMLRRRSVRKYKKESIPQEKLDAVINAGLLAPTSRGRKPCEFYIIRDRDILIKLAKAKKTGAEMLSECDTAIAVFGDSDKADTWIEDCSIAMSYMNLMAVEQDIGCCWVQMHMRFSEDGRDAEDNVRDILGVPDNYRIVGILALGIPEDQIAAHTMNEIDYAKVHEIYRKGV